MPIATFKSVREVSSENEVHCANNLLKDQHGKKWKTKTVGEKSAHVILELKEPAQITGIDIGNEHSAFVEVLVGKTACTNDNFKEILLTSSFMTPMESRDSTSINRVRCFGQEELVANIVSEKWHLVKIICTQPFNKHVHYGLSFIKIHIAAAPTTKTVASNKKFMFGKFGLREDSPDSESESTSGLFNRWKTARNSLGGSETSTAAQAIRQANAELRRLSEGGGVPSEVKKVQTPKPVFCAQKESDKKPEMRDRNREDLLFGDETHQPSGSVKEQRLERHIEADRKRLQNEEEEARKLKKQQSKQTNSQPQSSKAKDSACNSPNIVNKPINMSPNQTNKKRHSSPTHRPAKKMKSENTNTQYRPFNQLLRGVVLVISGIQNPDRADLRSKAIAMGAKYKADWEAGCTHLICAFKNTPKYNQVKGKGKIITRSWIEKCHDQKKYLPWRRYALDNKELTQPESDTEFIDESLKPHQNNDSDDEMDVTIVEPEMEHDKNTNDSLAMYDLGDANGSNRQQQADVLITSSGSDTEDEIQRVVQKNNDILNRSTAKEKERDIYEVTTDEEDYLEEKLKMEAKSK